MEKRAKTVSENTNRISLCFKWIYTILYYSGCVCFKTRKGVFHLTKTNIFYTNFIRIVLLISYFVSMAIKSSDTQGSKAMMERLSPVLKLILAMEFIISTITYITASILMETKKYKHIKVIKRFQQLDDGLQMNFPHVNWNYKKTEFKFTISTLVMLAYFYIISFMFLYTISNCRCDYVTTFVWALSYVIITTGPAGISFLHMGIMDLQRVRYRILQKLLQQHYAARSTKFKQKPDNNFELQLMCLIDYLKNYIQLILKFNDLFGVVSGVVVFHDFALVTFLTFLMCQLATETNAQSREIFLCIFFFMLAPIYKLSVYAMYGYMAYKEQQNCLHLVRVCENYYRCSELVRNQLRTFLHWQMQNSYTFLIGKVTRCDLALIFMAVNSIAGSTLILIQLQFQQNSFTKRIKYHE
ncbi:putative gustatory receptor 47b [Eurosta solidaginis]|uniref:putative gustatory receptor 47b n=1 Tax=Eurosta solidaginis TaxID=178769 RepID=UPI0035317B8B